jgi:ketosteroid isomerase-like protein
MTQAESEVRTAESEVRAAFEAYEQALTAGNVDALNGWFFDDERTVRFGVAEEQWGAEQVRRWRACSAAVPVGRTLAQTRISTFGPSAAVVTTLFSYAGESRVGRQSQTWVHFEQGWRIVNAHVSERATDG